jgi:hypothetical protein
MDSEACRRLNAGMLHVRDVKNSMPYQTVCWTAAAASAVWSYQRIVQQTKRTRLMIGKMICGVWLQDETGPCAPMCACGEADQG